MRIANCGLKTATARQGYVVLAVNPQSAIRNPQFAACLAALLLVTVAAPPALAWDDDTHEMIAAEAVARLPEPLRGLFPGTGPDFGSGDALKRLQAAAIAPDTRVAKLKAEKSPLYQAERVKHFFDIDAITTEAYPFTGFPRPQGGRGQVRRQGLRGTRHRPLDDR